LAFPGSPRNLADEEGRISFPSTGGAAHILLTDEVDENLTRLDRDSEVERLLTQLKARRTLASAVLTVATASSPAR
jgi:hypothetical protein